MKTKPPPARNGDRAAGTRIERALSERPGTWGNLLQVPALWAAVAVVACTWLLLPRAGIGLPDWAPGEVAEFDVVVPSDTSLPDEATTEAVREKAREQVLPVYDREPRLGQELADEIGRLFAGCREELEADGLELPTLAARSGLRISEPMVQVLQAARCSRSLETAIVDVAAQVYRTGIVDDLRALERRAAERGVAVRNLATMGERVVSFSELAEATDLRSGLDATLRTHLLEQDAVARRWIKATLSLLTDNMVPDLVFNRAETAARLRKAGEQVEPRLQLLRRGQMLVRRGDTVTPAVARTLRAIAERGRNVSGYASIVGVGLLLCLMVLGWWRLLARLGDAPSRRSRLSMILILLVLFVALNRLGLFVAAAVASQSRGAAMSLVDAYLWGLPYAAGPATVLILLGFQPAMLFAVCGALTAGVMLGGDFPTMVYALASGLVGAVAAEQLRERAALARVGALVGVANLAVLAVVLLYDGGLSAPPRTLVFQAVCAVAGGPLAIGVTSFMLPLLEASFGVATNLRLLELSNQNLPLLKRLSLEAPGSYQHSLAVSNLAEAGADAVGANSLLVRVCAYYHDIGKVLKPEYFVENQRGSNPHDALAPSMSALVISSHVKEGLVLAHKAKLPLAVRQAVATHHGTKLIGYFYDRAKERNDPEMGEVRDSDYRYRGPKPHSKELGILLLADAVEAAARTLENPAPAKLESLIQRIFADALEDGQLENTELTFREMAKIASAFQWALTSMYHHRVDYPSFDFNRSQGKREPSPVQLGAKAVAAGG